MSESSPPAKAADPAGQVFAWIVEGRSERDIVESIAEFFPGKDPKPLIVEAFGKLTEAGKVKADTLRGWCVEAIRHVYQKALDAGDLKTALAAIQQIQRIPE